MKETERYLLHISTEVFHQNTKVFIHLHLRE